MCVRKYILSKGQKVIFLSTRRLVSSHHWVCCNHDTLKIHYQHHQKWLHTTTKNCNKFTKYASYYSVLGLPQTASKSQIKRAYLEKCKKYHPDLHPGDDAMHEKFIKINEAYEALMDDSVAAASGRTRYPTNYHGGYKNPPKTYPFGRRPEPKDQQLFPGGNPTTMNFYTRTIVILMCVCAIYYVAISTVLYTKRHNYRNHIQKLKEDLERQQMTSQSFIEAERKTKSSKEE